MFNLMTYFRYSKTEILGYLKIGTLYLFSVENIEKLNLKNLKIGDSPRILLDIGAGCGEVT